MSSSPYSFFAIFSPARCRSSYLCNLLCAHPDIVCHSEVFHQEGPALYLRLKEISPEDLLFNLEWRDKHPQFYIERLVAETQRYRPQAKSIGCKLLLYPQQMQRGLEPILSFKPRVILLSRSNKLAWYSSLKIALETSQWFAEGGKKPTQQHTIFFDVAEFQNRVNLSSLCEEAAMRGLEKQHIPFLKVEYAELAQDKTIRDILRFLDLPDAHLTSTMSVQNTTNTLDRFNNREDVITFAAAIKKLAWLES